MCGHPDNGGLLEALSKDMAYRLHSVYPDARIVIFIRNQLDMIRSTYLQYIRAGGTYSLNRFLYPYKPANMYYRRWYKNPRLTLDHFSYQYLIRHYQNIFGQKNVHVFCYEEFLEDAQGFAEKYASRFDLEIKFDKLDYAHRNKSLGLISLQLARLLGPFSRWDNPNRLVLLPIIPMGLHKAALKAFNKTFLAGPQITSRQLFGKRLYADLQYRYATGNEELAKELGLPLARYDYPMTTADRESPL